MRYMICTIEFRWDGSSGVSTVQDNNFPYYDLKWHIFDRRLIDDTVLEGLRKQAMKYLKQMEMEGDSRLVGKEEWPILIVLKDMKKGIPVYYEISGEWRA